MPRLCSFGYELIISRRSVRLLGFGCVDERPENMEWWSYLNLSRREIHHVRCERGSLAPTFGANIVVLRLFSCGCAQMEKWTSSEAMSRPTRYVPEVSLLIPRTNTEHRQSLIVSNIKAKP